MTPENGKAIIDAWGQNAWNVFDLAVKSMLDKRLNTSNALAAGLPNSLLDKTDQDLANPDFVALLKDINLAPVQKTDLEGNLITTPGGYFDDAPGALIAAIAIGLADHFTFFVNYFSGTSVSSAAQANQADKSKAKPDTAQAEVAEVSTRIARNVRILYDFARTYTSKPVKDNFAEDGVQDMPALGFWPLVATMSKASDEAFAPQSTEIPNGNKVSLAPADLTPSKLTANLCTLLGGAQPVDANCVPVPMDDLTGMKLDEVLPECLLAKLATSFAPTGYCPPKTGTYPALLVSPAGWDPNASLLPETNKFPQMLMQSVKENFDMSKSCAYASGPTPFAKDAVKKTWRWALVVWRNRTSHPNWQFCSTTLTYDAGADYLGYKKFDTYFNTAFAWAPAVYMSMVQRAAEKKEIFTAKLMVQQQCTLKVDGSPWLGVYQDPRNYLIAGPYRSYFVHRLTSNLPQSGAALLKAMEACIAWGRWMSYTPFCGIVQPMMSASAPKPPEPGVGSGAKFPPSIVAFTYPFFLRFVVGGYDSGSGTGDPSYKLPTSHWASLAGPTTGLDKPNWLSANYEAPTRVYRNYPGAATGPTADDSWTNFYCMANVDTMIGEENPAPSSLPWGSPTFGEGTGAVLADALIASAEARLVSAVIQVHQSLQGTTLNFGGKTPDSTSEFDGMVLSEFGWPGLTFKILTRLVLESIIGMYNPSEMTAKLTNQNGSFQWATGKLRSKYAICLWDATGTASTSDVHP